MRTYPIVVVVFALSALPTQGRAQEEAQPDAAAPETASRDAEARGLFDAGQAAFNDGRFADAEDHFRRAYELSGRHVLLYNVALAADQARHDQAALEAYQLFLDHVPTSDRRTRVARRIEELRAIVQRGGAREERSPTDAPDAPTTGGGIDPAPWIVAGIGAAIAIGGGVLVGLAVSDVSAVENAAMNTPWTEVEDAYARTEPMSIAGFVMLGVGAAAIGGGIAWALTGGGSREAVQVRIGPGTASVQGSFR